MIFFITITILLSVFLSWWLTKKEPPEPLVIQDPIVSCPRCHKELIPMGFSEAKYFCWSVGGFTIEPYREKTPAHYYKQGISEFSLEMYFPNLKNYVAVGYSYTESYYIRYKGKIIKVHPFKPCESLEIIHKYFKLVAFS